jgi:adenylate cyclase
VKLSLQELAREAETEPSRIERLVAAGIIHPDDDGAFGPGDIQRSKLVGALEGAGISIDQLERAVEAHLTTFDTVELFYPAPSPRSNRTYAEFATSLGPRAHLLGPIHAALGFAEPDSDASLTERDEATLVAFIDTWDLGSDEVVTRAARIMGEAVRRAAEGWVDLFYEQVSDPVQRQSLEAGLPVEAMIPQIVPAASRVADLAPRMLGWLLDRHLEQILHARNIDSAEEQFIARGLAPPKPARPPAIVFADVSGFTRLTQAMGDQEGARMAVRLGELADATARRHGGRLVKLLGDGALLRFDEPSAAVLAALDLVESAPAAGLPPVHVGIHAGPLIVRDGDVYGHTVNVASRVGGTAGPGEIVVTTEVVSHVSGSTPVTFESIGPAVLNGVAEPLVLHRVARQPERPNRAST